MMEALQVTPSRCPMMVPGTLQQGLCGVSPPMVPCGAAAVCQALRRPLGVVTTRTNVEWGLETSKSYRYR